MTATMDHPGAPPTDQGFPTVASRVRDWALRHPDAVAMRAKSRGIWREITWSDLYDQILTAGHGLIALGVQPGDVVSIHSEDRPEWIILDMATVAVGGITTGMYPANPAAEVEYLLNDAGAGVHLAEDQEQVDKVLAFDAARFPALRTIIHIDTGGLGAYDDRRLMSWQDFMAMGAKHRTAHPGEVEQRMAAATADDVMTLVYTSGTTGPPKGAMLTNANADYAIRQVVFVDGRLPDNRMPGPDDQIVTYLPLCHIAERIFSTWTLASAGTVLNFAESIGTVQANLREVQPTLFFAVPRIWEKIHATVMIKLADASRFKRWFGKLGLGLGRFVARRRAANGGRHTAASRVVYWIGNPIFFRPLKERIGLRRCRWAGSGAAAVAPEVLEFFLGLGLNVSELYGMTENSAIATLSFDGRNRIGTVGEPYPGIGFRIDGDTGEIQVRHDGVFRGYWNQPDATRAAFTADGWLRTGDVGEWDGTHVRIVDRIRDIIITTGGKNISPSEIENSLKASPYVKEAMVVGDGRRYVTALIGIEPDTVGNWAVRRGIRYTTHRDLTERPEVMELVGGIVDQTNGKLSTVEQVKQFRLIPKELVHEDGELTATQKLKRSAMVAQFTDLVEGMYQ